MLGAFKKFLKANGQAFTACRSGIAAIEFALVGPVLLVLLFGVIEGSDALSRSRQVSLAVNTLADLVSQENELLISDAEDLFDGIEQIAAPNGGVVSIKLVSVIKDSRGNNVVHWSRDNAGNIPYIPGTPYTKLSTSTLIDEGASVIIGEVDYKYTSKLSRLVMPSIKFHRTATRWPRRSVRVQLCRLKGICTS
ncbi:TadE/TadG family type IV pilus assembly protein [Hyphococcus lacteus]|uniref:TadE/TadG family type IV pilus assembly protein n=1 Tax=Hyphococcus lacteus TaxID=3143536 RepID=A0ABV3Z2Y1_9PROT